LFSGSHYGENGGRGSNGLNRGFGGDDNGLEPFSPLFFQTLFLRNMRDVSIKKPDLRKFMGRGLT